MRGTWTSSSSSWFLRAAGSALLVTFAIFACKKDPDPVEDDPNRFSGDGGPNSASSSSSGSTGADGNASSGNPPATQYTDPKNETMEFGGATQHYILAKPKNYDATKKYPMVMSFHGDCCDKGAGMAKGFPFETVTKSDAVLAYPDAPGDDWDIYATPNQDWIKALIDEIAANKANIDKTKVFGFGYSNGGFFLTQITCLKPGLFKAISVNAGGGPDEGPNGQQGCMVCPAGPIAALVIHGQNDNVVGTTSGDTAATCIAARNGCEANRSASTPTDCQVNDGCPAATPVKYCFVPNVGHDIYNWGPGVSESWKFFTTLP